MGCSAGSQWFDRGFVDGQGETLARYKSVRDGIVENQLVLDYKLSVDESFQFNSMFTD